MCVSSIMQVKGLRYSLCLRSLNPMQHFNFIKGFTQLNHFRERRKKYPKKSRDTQ